MISFKVYIRLWVAITLVIANLHVCGQSYYRKALKQYDLKRYSIAIDLFKRSITKKMNYDALLGLAKSYYHIGDFNNSEYFYSKSLLFTNAKLQDSIEYMDVLIANEKYNEAKLILSTIPKSIQAENEGIKKIFQVCDSAIVWTKKPSNCIISDLTFNSIFSDVNCGAYHSGLLISSDKFILNKNKAKVHKTYTTDKISTERYDWTGDYYYRPYLSIPPFDSMYSFLDSIGINTKYHLAGLTFTADYNEVFFTITKNLHESAGIFEKEQPVTFHNQIYYCRRDTINNRWSKAIPFKHNNPLKYSVGDPFISNDGKVLYFVCDTKDAGFGGTDIYYSTRIGVDDWSPMVNLGAEINTKGDERTPYLLNSKELYYSTNGLPGMGGLDVFRAVYNNGIWHTENLKFPINSSRDDFAMVALSPYSGFFTSNRLGTKGKDDVFKFCLDSTKPYKKRNLYIKWTFKDAETGVSITKPIHIFINNCVVSTINDSVYQITDSNCQINAGIRCHGYFNNNLAVSLNLLKRSTTDSATYFYLDVPLVKIKDGYTIPLKNIYFDRNKSDLDSAAKVEIDQLYNILIDNPTISIEIASHTDSRATESYNLSLSQKRANAVKNYLVNRGINPNRLFSKGYGESKLLNKCSSFVDCTEQEHLKNRRTEFTIIKTQ